MMRSWAFLGTALCVALALAGLSIGLGIYADPYRVFGTEFLQHKPQIYQKSEMAKTYQMERIAPRTLLLGNSRIEIGLDPRSHAWPANLQPVFNAALAGHDLSSALDMFREGLAVRHLSLVVVGLDIQDFMENARPEGLAKPTNVDQRRLLWTRDGQPNRERVLQRWLDRLTSTLTINAGEDSIYTLVSQNDREGVDMTPEGLNPLDEYNTFVRRSGYYELFAQRNTENSQRFRSGPRPDFSAPNDLPNFRFLKEICVLAESQKVPVIFLIHPYHAEYLEMLHRLELWEEFEDWERAVVRAVTSSGHCPARIYDFASYNRFTTEPVPVKSDRHSIMKWYWEAGHYKRKLGDQVLGAIFRHIPPDMAIELRSDNIERVLSTIREGRLEYISHHASVAKVGVAE